MLGTPLVVADQAPVAVEPAKASFYDLPAGKHDEPADLVARALVKVYVEARCPRCSIRLASYTKYVESPRAIIGGTVTISFTGSCYNRGGAGSGVFDWSGTVTSGYIYQIP